MEADGMRSAGFSRFLGLLVLDTRFVRLPGDAGRPDSYAMPVRSRVVQGATPQRVVQQGDLALLQPFIAAAQALVAEGAGAITTSCGFLLRWHAELQAALPVPVWTSSLLWLHDWQRPGILTVDAHALGGISALAGVPRAGLAPDGHLHRVLMHQDRSLDPAQAQADAVAAAKGLLQAHPDITDVVLECTNLPPYASAIAAATQRPVHHVVSLVNERWKALHP